MTQLTTGPTGHLGGKRTLKPNTLTYYEIIELERIHTELQAQDQAQTQNTKRIKPPLFYDSPLRGIR